MDTQSTRPLVASISLLLKCLNTADIDLTTQRPQLLVVDVLFNSREQRGIVCGLSGAYSDDTVRWLSTQPDLSRVTDAMQSAHSILFKVEGLHQHEFRAEVSDNGGWLNMNCPGDACGLDPYTTIRQKESSAYEFTCHNIDNTLQQLTLLAGLAALHDQVKEGVSHE
mgnify:CR=1 FL=1